jgi:hypothetical protein
MDNIGDKQAAELWAVWEAQKALAAGTNQDQLSPAAQAAYIQLVALNPALPGHVELDPRARRRLGLEKANLLLERRAADANLHEPEPWRPTGHHRLCTCDECRLAEYQAVMAEPLALPEGALDKLAPYAPDPIPGLGRLIAATTPARRRQSAHPAVMYVWGVAAVLLALGAYAFWPFAIGAIICMLLAVKSL